MQTWLRNFNSKRSKFAVPGRLSAWSWTSPRQSVARLGLSPRETPASVEIIGQDAIQRLGARSLTEAMGSATGVTTGVPGGAPGVVSMRGFTGNAITYLFDGTRIQGAAMTARPMDSWNFERIEVLRGPASVLYGEGALVGAINFVTRRPSRDNAVVEGLVSYGSFDMLRTAGGVGGPLGTASAYRMDFARTSTGGFIDRMRGEMWNFGALRNDAGGPTEAFQRIADTRCKLR